MIRENAWRVMEPASPRPRDNDGRRRLRILCAEDNTMVGEMLVRVLTLFGHTAELAPDGEAAWARLMEELGSFDLLITDHHMPRCTGLELVQRLRNARFPGRIIVHSNALGAPELEAYWEFGVDAIVAKGAAGATELLHAIATTCGEA